MDKPPISTAAEVSAGEVNNAFVDFEEHSFRPTEELYVEKNYRAVIVETNSQVRSMLVEWLRFSGFDAEGYANGDIVLQMALALNQQMPLPDLLVIDVEPQPGNVSGLKLIEHLVENNISSAIIATSASLSAPTFLEAMKMGADYVAGKPFEPRLIDRMENLARLGKRRRMYRMQQTAQKDPTRNHRPVFLSYSDKDRRIAAIIRSRIEAHEIGVWYASDTLQPGDLFREEILNAIDHARVFVPVITNNYTQSAFCMAELLRFYRRMRGNSSPLLLPVLHGAVDQMPSFDWIKWVFNEHQYADITADRFINGLTALIGQIEKAVRGRRY